MLVLSKSFNYGINAPSPMENGVGTLLIPLGKSLRENMPRFIAPVTP